MTTAFPQVRSPLHRQPTVTVRRRVRPRPAVDLSRLTRYRGGTYSHTVETIRFTDGTSARTDLIRLNPGVPAYSLDYTGVAPTRPSRYQVETFSEVPNLRARAFEVEVDWILRNSFPNLRVAELSRRLRAAGSPLGKANIGEHEAIAATQAAIWHLTNGLQLDNRPLDVPARLVRSKGAVTVEFDGERELASYAVEMVADGAATVTLHSSVDGQSWREVAASQLTVEGAGTHRRTLGVGATVSVIRHGRPSVGHRFYRLTATGGAEIADVAFTLNGSGRYRNPERIVRLYNYLLDGARRARSRATAPRLTAAHATMSDGLVGPFRLAATDRAALDAGPAELVDADGVAITGPVHPGTSFYLRPRRGSTSATVTMTVPGSVDGYGGRVLAGVARDESTSRFTPLALAVPAELVVDFDVDWSW
ncbi:MAG TPA: thioester domain-containing protein [Mycobacterium sp.]